MELMVELPAEQLPLIPRTESLRSLVQSAPELCPELIGPITTQTLRGLSEELLTEKLISILLEKICAGSKEAAFQLGQLYFENAEYEKALPCFLQAAENNDIQAIFQLGIMFYDGLGCNMNQKKAVEYMFQVAAGTSPRAKTLLRCAQYNIGRAYYEGYGVQQSDKKAEWYWVLAADDGNPNASIKAQTMLGMYYSREETRNLKLAFFWHSEACGNGSLESQGALGVMYQHGLCVQQDAEAAFICLRESAERGNVYSMGNLISYYYTNKLFTKTVELAARVSLFENPKEIAQETDCLLPYVSKGISMACFYYARCLHRGLAIQKNEKEARKLYSKSFLFDADMCAFLHNLVKQGQI